MQLGSVDVLGLITSQYPGERDAGCREAERVVGEDYGGVNDHQVRLQQRVELATCGALEAGERLEEKGEDEQERDPAVH